MIVITILEKAHQIHIFSILQEVLKSTFVHFVNLDIKMDKSNCKIALQKVLGQNNIYLKNIKSFHLLSWSITI